MRTVISPHFSTRLTPKRRVAVGAVAVLALLSACGNREDTLQVISFSASQSARSANDSALSATGESSDAKMMAPVMNVNYVVDGNLDDFGASAQSWIAKPVAKPNTSAMKKIASALGVKAELKEQSKDMGGGFVAGPTDGSAPSVMFSGVSRDGLGDPYLGWYYNTGYAMESSSSAGAAVAPDSQSSNSDSSISDTTTVIDEPREQSQPKNLPTANEATTIVEGLLASMGQSLDSMSIEANTDNWGTYATAWREYGGIRSPLSWNFGFGSDAELRYASGAMIEFSKGPKYPQVNTTAGVERLGDPRYSGWFGYGIMASDTATKSATSALTEPAVAPSSEVAPVEPLPVPETAVAETVVEGVPETVVEESPVAQDVSIVSVAQSLTPVIDSENNVWLLPSYDYTTKEGYTVSALALEDKYIDQTNGDTTTTIVEPGPIEPGPMEPNPIEPGPSDGASTPGDAGGGSSGSPGTATIVDGGSIGSEVVLPTEADAKSLIGMGEAEAVKLIESRGWVARIGSRDGEEYMLTMDYSDSRITLGIEKAIVVTATIG
jgi:hypothetical protein